MVVRRGRAAHDASRGLGVGAFEAGDAFLYGDSLLVAAGPRTDRAAHGVLARELGVASRRSGSCTRRSTTWT